MNSGIEAAILAGGQSRRNNGFPKAFMEVEGKTVLNRIYEVLEPIFERITIIGSTTTFDPTRYRVVDDILKGYGPLGGIHTALTQAKCNLVFVVSSDMPFLSMPLIEAQISAFILSNSDISIPSHSKGIEPLHGIYSKMVIPTIEAQLKESADHRIRSFFDKVKTQYFSPENLSDFMIAFSNINSTDDLKQNSHQV
jgi:molybdopterin-guanine dinucleotide biosynthesis protein A